MTGQRTDSDGYGWRPGRSGPGADINVFLEEKQRRSGSERTAGSYAAVLNQFFAACTKQPVEVSAADVSAFAGGTGSSGKPPSPATVAARLTALSSFFRFLLRAGLIQRNPCDLVSRPKQVAGLPKGLNAGEVRRLLAVVPATPEGLRDRALLIFMALTGRRRTEAISLRAGDIEPGDPAFYRYRGKGGVRGRRELPPPVTMAIEVYLTGFGKVLSQMAADEPVWMAGVPGGGGVRALSAATFYARFRRFLALAGLPPTGLHALRHTAAKLRRDAGATVEEVSAFLDYSSLAVTTTYLRRVEGARDTSWRGVADRIGLA